MTDHQDHYAAAVQAIDAAYTSSIPDGAAAYWNGSAQAEAILAVADRIDAAIAELRTATLLHRVDIMARVGVHPYEAGLSDVDERLGLTQADNEQQRALAMLHAADGVKGTDSAVEIGGVRIVDAESWRAITTRAMGGEHRG